MKTIPHDVEKFKMTKGFDIMRLPTQTFEPGKETKIELVKDSPPVGTAPNIIPPFPVGVKLTEKPNIKGDKISFTARYTISQQVENKSPKGQMRIKITSRDLYVSGVAKVGEETLLDSLYPEQSKKITFLMVLKTNPK